MTENQARHLAQYCAQSRSATYAVVLLPASPARGLRCHYDYFPRFSDLQGRTDKGNVVATYNAFGQRIDTEN